MNNFIYPVVIRFVILVLFQILICNNINLFGFITPYPYILYILLFPYATYPILFLCLSFLMGLTIDMFQDTGAINAAACVVIAYLRPWVLKLNFGVLYDYQAIKFNNADLDALLTYTTILTLIHHLILFSLESFKFSDIFIILKSTFFNSLFTVIVSMIIIILFSRKLK